MSQGAPDPERWRDIGAWRELALDLDERAGTGPSAEQQARLLARLEELDAAPHARAPAWPGAGKSTRLGIALLAGAVALYAVWSAQRALPSRVVPDRDSAQSTPKSASESSAPPPTAPALPTPEVAPPVRASKPIRDSKGRSSRSSPAAKAPAPAPDDARDPAAELGLLTRARRVLLADPARSLELAEEHALRYPRGVFAEEREVLAVEALLRAGKVEAGQKRGQRFLRLHENSAHTVRMRELMSPRSSPR